MRVLRRRRSENHIEYIAIAGFVMTCSVVTLLVAGAGNLRRVADARNLCVIQDGECARLEDEVANPDNATDADDDDPAYKHAREEGGSADHESGANLDRLTGNERPSGYTIRPHPRPSDLTTDGDTSPPPLEGNGPLLPVDGEDEDTKGLVAKLVPPPPPPLDPFGIMSSLSSLAKSFANSSEGQTLFDGFKGIFGWFA